MQDRPRAGISVGIEMALCLSSVSPEFHRGL